MPLGVRKVDDSRSRLVTAALNKKVLVFSAQQIILQETEVL